ncbi:MAG: hypothetical protein ACREAK_00805 [Nitrosarchaeum sp.]
MKSLLIIVLITVIGLAIIGGGVGPFVDNVEKGGEKVYQSDEFQTVFQKGKDIVSKVFDVKLSLVDDKVSDKQLAMAQRIQQLTNKGNSISQGEFNELRTLVNTYEKNWGI